MVLVLAVAAGTAAQARPEGQRRRDQMQIMEGVLTRAVRVGAEQLGRRLQSVNPGVVLFTGDARARGFLLDGYGVFFDVEIPALRKSVMWTMRTLDRDAATAGAIDALRRTLESLPDNPARLQAQQALKRIELEIAPLQQTSTDALAAPPAAPAQRGSVAATSVTATPETVSADDQDPDVAYTESVKRALIDAMLDYSLPLDLQPDEWLTVAARDSEGPLIQGQVDDAMTILLRIKGSDVAAFAADRNKRDEARKRVEVHVF
jgi:hypothetical protein